MNRDARRLLDRAWRTFLGARMVARRGNADLVAVLAYRAMETAARALLAQRRIYCGPADDVHQQFTRRLVGEDARGLRWLQWLLDAHDVCVQAEVAVEARLTDAAARTLLERAGTMVREARDRLWTDTARRRAGLPLDPCADDPLSE
jgi:HEPN domain-containing protein